MGLMDKIFGTYSERELKRIYPIRDKVLSLEEQYSKMSDKELKDLAIAIAKGVIAFDHHRPAQTRAVHLDRIGHGVEAEHVVIACKRACRAGNLLV